MVFLALEQFLHWHHCHRAFAECRKPLGYLILIGDGLHNLLGGIADVPRRRASATYSGLPTGSCDLVSMTVDTNPERGSTSIC